MAERLRSSLQRRLFGWLMLPLLVALPLLGLALYEQVQHSAQTWLDEALEDTALTLAGQIDIRGGEPRIDISATMDRALRFDRQDDVFYLVLGPHGEVLQGDAGLADLQPRPVPQPVGGTYYGEVRLRGRELRLAQLGQDCGSGVCQVLVAETLHKRDALQSEIGGLVALNGAGLTLLLALAGWWAIRQGMAPLTDLSAELEHRDLHRLTPLSASLPRELVPLQSAFNRLFERLARAAEAQREFLADAAHQLRTPLTSLQTEIELAMLEPHDQRLDPLLARLRQRVQRSARLAQQLLSLARAEDRSVDVGQRIDLRDIATESGQDWAHRDLPSGVDLGFELADAPARGHAFLLRELLENLIHNAVNYAGAGARITVRCGNGGEGPWLEVEDNGPGIPPAERAAAMQRFRRGSSAVGTGSGLGLAIAADIASRHGGRLELLDAHAGPGLRARLTLPLPGPAPAA
ncbi:sensor histidine kinase [Roseateles saccharophilus]|uniref:histidine kinase n=1 Tax=Roseateles saccharophilus TaxID=304 RepID=A0A4R3UYE4_ROSSA|nr:sensor histidine kinase [Roseateles saccharophilus]MDG0831977.1 sensor histidine kinase [Roseateles saccharophilus]TCU97356.1 two-component system sensor histidine kinase TctE [Roseateles saccharophilus]